MVLIPNAPAGLGTFVRLVSLSQPGCPFAARLKGPIV